MDIDLKNSSVGPRDFSYDRLQLLVDRKILVPKAWFDDGFNARLITTNPSHPDNPINRNFVGEYIGDIVDVLPETTRAYRRLHVKFEGGFTADFGLSDIDHSIIPFLIQCSMVGQSVNENWFPLRRSSSWKVHPVRVVLDQDNHTYVVQGHYM